MQADTEEIFQAWITALQIAIQSALHNSSAGRQHVEQPSSSSASNQDGIGGESGFPLERAQYVQLRSSFY